MHFYRSPPHFRSGDWVPITAIWHSRYNRSFCELQADGRSARPQVEGEWRVGYDIRTRHVPDKGSSSDCQSCKHVTIVFVRLLVERMSGAEDKFFYSCDVVLPVKLKIENLVGDLSLKGS